MNDLVIVNRRHLGYFLMVALICLVYANSFQASWHLDDYVNIVYNPKLHLNDLSVSSVVDTLYASPWNNHKLYRPAACLTFALNWYVGQDNVFGYHLINLLIHCLTAIFLVKTVLLVFRTPMLIDHYSASDAPYWIALLAATIWAIHPIQTQAVTYIVQRMAALAGMFYIAGLFCFLKGRLHPERGPALVWYVGAALAYVFALGSKENAVIFPLGLMLMEVALFRPRLFSTTRQRFILATVISVVALLGVITVLLVSEEAMNSLYASYDRRYFNHSERLLTQFRILVYYLFQIAYPNTAHLSVDHDVIVSTGLFAPWTTLPSLILIFGALWGLLYFLPKFPLLGFGGLFFLLHHSVESTFLPLELIFEHRNYIPSMFLFTGVAGGLYRLILFYRDRSALLHRFLICSCALALCFVGMGTFSRNADWRTEKSLWEDAIKKAPNNARASHNLAWGYYERIGDTDTALALYQQATHKQAHRKDSTGTAFLNMGNIYYNRGDYGAAIDQFKESLVRNPRNIKARLRLVYSCIALSRWDVADSAINDLIPYGQRLGEIFRLRGFILLNKHQPAEALDWFRQARASGESQWEDLAGIGQSLNLMGHYTQADFFLRSAQALVPGKLFLFLNRLDLYLDAGQNQKAMEMADWFVRSIPAGKVAAVWNKLSIDSNHYPLRYQRMRPFVEAALKRTLDGFNQNKETLDGFNQNKELTAQSN